MDGPPPFGPGARRFQRRVLLEHGPWDAPGPRPRRRRGDVRAGILRVLADSPGHGYEIIRTLEERSGGTWRPSPGSVYPTLQLLEDEGLVVSKEVDGRRVYELTDDGRSEASARAERGERTQGEATEDLALRDELFGLTGAVRQIVRGGTPEQRSTALETVREARRALYRLLAE